MTRSTSDGLSEVEARQRLAQDGPNELPVSRLRGVLRLLREIVAEPMFLLLVACGAIYRVLGDRQEALMLLGFAFVVMGISFVQQRRSERSLEALRDLSSPRALTGESAPVLKEATQGTDEAAVAPDASDPSKVYSGTLVTRVTARGCVEATGARSALGQMGPRSASLSCALNCQWR